MHITSDQPRDDHEEMFWRDEYGDIFSVVGVFEKPMVAGKQNV